VTDNLQTLSLPDGRTLGYAEWGDPSGTPVLMLHGTPGCRLNRHPDNDKVAATGARVITYDRPGYGESDRHPGRAVVDCVADVEALVDHLGVDRFAVSGGSGGGPHSLAVAAGLSDRVTRAACLVGVAPYDVLGDAWFEGMDPQNVKEFGWAVEGEQRLAEELPREARQIVERVTNDPSTALANFDMPEADLAVLARPDVAAVLRDAIVECFRNGIWGWADNDLAFAKPWGFDPATITVPTAVWWGSQDVLVPAGHGEWIAKTVPTSVVRINDSGGHMGDPEDSIDNLYPWLVGGIRWSD
jgi:pimeloyl-ACP methyl ester carboxylesterase